MKIVDQFGHEPANENMRKRRMEALLSAWRPQPFWLRVEDGRLSSGTPHDQSLSPSEWAAWCGLLRAALPVPPRTHIEGLEAHARLQGLAVEELKAQNVITIEGPRVATRWIGNVASERLGGSSWTLSASREELGLQANECEAVVRKRFREVSEVGDLLVASVPVRPCADSVVALIEQAFAQPDSASLARLWKLALSLEVGDAFVDQLPSAACKTLAEALATELNQALGYLGVLTDARLEFFAEGQQIPTDFVIPETSLPHSRLTSLLEAQRFMEHHHQGLSDHYFEDVAKAFTSMADTFPLGEILRHLPPGRAHSAAVEQILRTRPELIATYVWHPAFHAEGAFLLLQLLQRVHLDAGRTLELGGEWEEVQRLGREQLVFADRSDERASVVALGVHDEETSITRQHYDVSPSHLRPQVYEDAGVWAKAVSRADAAEVYVVALDEFFHAPVQHPDSAFVFSLKLLAPLREHHHVKLMRRLASTVVDGYAASVALDIATMAESDVLPAYGSLLEDLRAALDETEEGKGQWARWLRPFELTAYIEDARKDKKSGYDSREVRPSFAVPRCCAHTPRFWWRTHSRHPPLDLLSTLRLICTLPTRKPTSRSRHSRGTRYREPWPARSPWRLHYLLAWVGFSGATSATWMSSLEFSRKGQPRTSWRAWRLALVLAARSFLRFSARCASP